MLANKIPNVLTQNSLSSLFVLLCVPFMHAIKHTDSQAGKMDLGDIYVPHDVSFAWVAVLFGQMLAPTVINNVIKRRWKRALVAFLVVMSPYLLKKIGLRRIINKRTIAKNRLIGKQDDGFFTSDGDGGGDGRSTTVVCPHCGSQVKRTRGLTFSKSLMDISSMV